MIDAQEIFIQLTNITVLLNNKKSEFV